MIACYSWNLFFPYALLVLPSMWTDEFVESSHDWLTERGTLFFSFGFFYVFRNETDRLFFILRWA
jgi:hypothetical protein